MYNSVSFCKSSLSCVGSFQKGFVVPKLTVREVPGHWNFFVSRCGRVFRKNAKGDLVERKVTLLPIGYYMVGNFYVHRLLAFAYLGSQPSPKHIVCHLNDVKTDNRLENLYWGTRKQNEEDKTSNGGRPVGEEHVNCVLTEKQVLDLRQEYLEGGTSHRKLSAKYGVHFETIRDAILGTTWTYLTENVEECRELSKKNRNKSSDEINKRVEYLLTNTCRSKSCIARDVGLSKTTVCRMAKKLKEAKEKG